MSAVRHNRAVAGWAAAGLCSLAALGCTEREPSAETTIRVWAHQGRQAENRVMRDLAEAFEAAHADRGLSVDISFFPDAQYTEKISIAAAAGDLPDVLDLDGPTLAQFVEADLLQPIDRWFPADVRSDFLPTVVEQGTLGGRLYALGAYDSALVLYADRRRLREIGVSPPAGARGWPWERFLEVCERLKQSGIRPVALHMDQSADEWFTYAFSPLLWSAGGRLIAEDGRTVLGVLDSERNADVLRRWQGLFEAGYTLEAPIDPDPFGSGATAMDWNGHWMAESHLETYGTNLVAMPLPATGPRNAAACGSWCWGLSRDAENPDAAAEWLRWVTHPTNGIAPMVRVNGAVPARESAVDALPASYRTEPYTTFRALLKEAGRPRPRTPYYPDLTRHFAGAMRDIAGGAEPARRLREAAEDVQRIVDRREGGR